MGVDGGAHEHFGLVVCRPAIVEESGAASRKHLLDIARLGEAACGIYGPEGIITAYVVQKPRVECYDRKDALGKFLPLAIEHPDVRIRDRKVHISFAFKAHLIGRTIIDALIVKLFPRHQTIFDDAEKVFRRGEVHEIPNASMPEEIEVPTRSAQGYVSVAARQSRSASSC